MLLKQLLASQKMGELLRGGGLGVRGSRKIEKEDEKSEEAKKKRRLKEGRVLLLASMHVIF